MADKGDAGSRPVFDNRIAESKGIDVQATLLSGQGSLIYETSPTYAHGRFHVWHSDRDSLAFLCPGDFIRAVLRNGRASLEAQGDGLGWHRPYGIRKEIDDGNVRTDISGVSLNATREDDSLRLVAELTIDHSPLQVRITLDAADLAEIGPDYAELWYGQPHP